MLNLTKYETTILTLLVRIEIESDRGDNKWNNDLLSILDKLNQEVSYAK